MGEGGTSPGNSYEGVLIMAENLVDLHEGFARLRLRLSFPVPSILIQATSLQEVLNAPLCWPFSSRYCHGIATVFPLYCHGIAVLLEIAVLR